jgi:hypothetical protein
MLHPKLNRIDYGAQLIPPDGYELTCAVGTTYSLDIEALMLLPVALFYAQYLDGNPEEIRFDMLEAITKASEKITVFYQNGQLKAPKKYHPLIAYWEEGIQAVTMPHHASSFHPKTWIIRYDCKKESPIYRLLATSRNLTFDRSWDVAYSSMGYVTDSPQNVNQPLVDFLMNLTKSTKKEISAEFINDLKYVEFDQQDGIKNAKFWPIGVDNLTHVPKKYPNPLSQKKWDDLLIISPFLDNSTLKGLRDNCQNIPYLLSTKEALDGILDEIVSSFDCWQFSDFFEKAEYFKELEEEGIEPMQQNLHSKLYIGTQNDKPFWYIGSANCTDPAQGRNIEFLAELHTENRKDFYPKAIFKSLTEPKKADGVTLFVPYDPNLKTDQTERQKIDLAIREIKYQLSGLHIKGEVILIPEGAAYNLQVEIDASNITLPKDFTIFYKPVSETQKKESKLNVGSKNLNKQYGGYGESWLSPYLVFSIQYKDETFSRFLLTMEIELPASRLNKIFTSIIDSREKFLKYLAFLLTGEETGVIGDPGDNKGGRNDDDNVWGFDDTPVFEKLMIAASRTPEKLTSIDKLIERIKDESASLSEPIITKEFEGFWSVFKDYMNSRK